MEQIMTDQLSTYRVLFLCTGNSCRSQMAEGWARHQSNGKLVPCSAGTKPQGVNPLAVRVMAEVGIDISSNSSKHLNSLPEDSFEYLVTVCDSAHEACPVLSGRVKKLHVGFDDPPKLAASARTEEEALSHYRRVRDEIREFVVTLPERLGNL